MITPGVSLTMKFYYALETDASAILCSNKIVIWNQKSLQGLIMWSFLKSKPLLETVVTTLAAILTELMNAVQSVWHLRALRRSPGTLCDSIIHRMTLPLSRLHRPHFLTHYCGNKSTFLKRWFKWRLKQWNILDVSHLCLLFAEA